ncbi:MAG: Eco57I restriction-modification methylase domain-containing protein [Microcoleus sp. PH2017_01_SCD_O_A]|uniref:Eco57I restriction-modification methylase domain-containing protein n=1 Tax=unclassified Microcoleus TaxID=2642155 RepID=UPI001D3DF725|nr:MULTISPECIES: Eco57I restriction-modification methylase domain-containing protein [unclassified Microcoleus]TAE07767.1 MAG: methyltransferase [Oscillatoriales cyanobacterium]MCC3427364.1 Eco57I restriction-modification methylase domain-containing protein [Microcoleus sp. PH2017_01_SCD_O_A]MCC3569147.1 Eco57I restriction-modification methylase domain-containing protein [Microcoleus sp. PH2017_31_RDM_U_A]MCC3581446.1 Eco57I restriction-modification methylase domain-containing protein [Microcol
MNRQALIDPKDDIISLQSAFLRSKSLESRKILGQFFTGFVVSDYMASLIVKPKSKTIRILDAGAGTGILAASTAFYCLSMGCKAVHAVLYELDSEAVASLKQTLNIVQCLFCEQLGTFTYEICCEDFIIARPDKEKTFQPFDISVINPPYFKYSAKDSPYARAVADLYHGDPNIYASFMAVVMACMKAGGQMVTITPRSFTNGLYFKGFREYLLTESALRLIHIFKHRDKVFNNDDSTVLQENIICYFVKGSNADTITVRSSDCDASINNAEEKQYPVHLIVDPSNDQRLIRIPESASAASILKQAETLKTTFEGAGYFISTGRVVEHRARQYITEDTSAENTVPLYRPHNVTPLTATWIGNHKKDVAFRLNEEHDKHTMKNGTYVLLKRFSSKDEKRRLVASVHLANMHDCELIGFGNKTNYIGVLGGELSNIEAYGLATIFNSSFMDNYFRCISGNTQVNATEIRVMKFPSRDQVKKIGEQVHKLKLFETAKIDSIVNRVLGVVASI